MEGYLDIKKPLSDSEVTLSAAEVKRLIRALDPTGDDLVLNYDSRGGMGYPSRTWSVEDTLRATMSTSDSDSEILAELANGMGNPGKVLKTTRELLGYDGYIVEGKYDDATVYVAFDSSQFKNVTNQNPTGDADIRYSTRDYSYDALTRKPDMPVTEIDDSIQYQANSASRKAILQQALAEARRIGRVNENGNAVIHVKDTDTDVILGARALRHGLDRRFAVNAPVTVHVGKILENSIRINEMNPREENTEASYVLVGVAKNAKNEPYIVQFVVNRHSNEVSSVDVLYAVNAKTEPAGSLSPKITGVPATLTGSDISIALLLNYVNRYFPDSLPEDVLRHFGYRQRPAGKLGDSMLFQLRGGMSNREILASVFMDAAKNEIERGKIREYQSKIEEQNAEEAKLYKVRAQLKEASFSPGKKDKAKISQLRDEATKLANRISIRDKQLLRLEASKPLMAVLEREKDLAYKRASAKWGDRVEKMRTGRSKTEMRHKVQRAKRNPPSSAPTLKSSPPSCVRRARPRPFSPCRRRRRRR